MSNEKSIGQTSEQKTIWAYLVHLSYDQFEEYSKTDSSLRFETSLWNDILEKIVDVGMNMIVIDIGDAVKYKSHPEIAIRDAWTVERLKNELNKVREMGIEPIPKLNFSTTHHGWLGPYTRCVSSEMYYEVCRDLIAELIEIFDKPRFFHLGMDEEAINFQQNNTYVVVRQHDLWWHDFYFLAKEVENSGARAWIWSDYLWGYPFTGTKTEDFFVKMPKSVVQSNWYYGADFNEKIRGVKTYIDLEEHGYDQIPTGSNWGGFLENFQGTVAYCREHIAPERLLGFLQTCWKPTEEAYRQFHIQAIELAGQAVANWTASR